MVWNTDGICPYKIIDEYGVGFSTGIVLGSVFHFFRGVYISPKKEKLFGGITQLIKKAPILGGSFGVWAGILAINNCLLLSKFKEDSYKTQIIGGSITGGILSLRGGAYSILRGSINGGLFLGLFDMIQEYNMKKQITEHYKKEQIVERNNLYNYLLNVHPHLEDKIIYDKNNLSKKFYELDY